MDATDRRILAELQQDGRLSLTELAERVQLSMSPTHRRLRALEESGAITGYRAVIDPDAVGLGFGALVFITMDQANRATVPDFDAAVAEIPEVIQALRLFGDPDYLLRVAVPDLPSYQRLWDDRLSALPGVRRVESTLVMKTVVDDRPLPV
ncbi:Lrp/AsnC family transcriptional regulator [Agromyces mangrovi Wang et al. 2018]|uniref:Lrp/AsnC family transcriptional regulator n=1 Tax=Agromyces mangrovi TaxID=1858653 RepID=UPI0025743457|nr:Lrp/AsnC family transcriptional regulator [Agromyces mangrovi]BDZ65423.1 AsnC family transcriptional regulator [Agromyces mangrovi]